MNYKEANEYLKIADNALRLKEWDIALDILTNLAHFIVNDQNLTDSEHKVIYDAVKNRLGSFQTCPDECCWEKSCNVYDLFR